MQGERILRAAVSPCPRVCSGLDAYISDGVVIPSRTRGQVLARDVIVGYYDSVKYASDADEVTGAFAGWMIVDVRAACNGA